VWVKLAWEEKKIRFSSLVIFHVGLEEQEEGWVLEKEH